MQLGFIGAGNMATALARGIGEPVLVSRRRRAHAPRRWPPQLGGEALGSNAEVAERADAVVLCHKPGQLATVAEELGDRPKAVVSILGGTPLAALELAYPGKPVYRFMPNIPAEVRPGRARLRARHARRRRPRGRGARDVRARRHGDPAAPSR